MEEEVKKDVVATEESNKPTYEQLKNWLDQVVAQRNQVAEKLNQVTNIINKLPWLFRVIENKDSFTPEFVTVCANEIVDIMTVTPEEKAEEDNKE